MKNFPVRTLPHSNLNRSGASGSENGFHPSGTVVTPNGIPTIVVNAIPIRIAPGTFRM